ncbi:uncharacterized protein LOC132624700 [Lycium barbarum]|uniref:uncharacterized protein LOC132624700 n=1 Tax=Lycium barbarum TaxID=112863 RepID=UPI00293F5E04|nr:uncharacterized protein LOC132624700 [Lycium barbarum]
MSANTETTSQDVPAVSSQGAEPASKPKEKTFVELTALDIVPSRPNYSHEFDVEKPSPIADRGFDVRRYRLPKGSVEPRPEPAAEPAAPDPEFDTAGSSRLIAIVGKRRRKPSDKGQKPKKKARSVVRTLRDESESDFLIQRDGEGPSVASFLEEEATIPPFPTAEEGPSVPAPYTGGEEVLFPTPLRSIEFIDISSDASPEEIPLQRPRRSGPSLNIEAEQRAESAPDTDAPTDTCLLPSGDPTATFEAPASTETVGASPSSNIEAEQRAESAPDTEAPMDTCPLPGGDPTTTSEAPAFTETVGASPTSPTPVPRSDNLDDMFSDTPPATKEVFGFGHLPIPRVTRPASRSTKKGARNNLVAILVVTVPED